MDYFVGLKNAVENAAVRVQPAGPSALQAAATADLQVNRNR
jgi:hypothetical protein